MGGTHATFAASKYKTAALKIRAAVSILEFAILRFRALRERLNNFDDRQEERDDDGAHHHGHEHDHDRLDDRRA